MPTISECKGCRAQEGATIQRAKIIPTRYRTVGVKTAATALYLPSEVVTLRRGWCRVCLPPSDLT